MCGIVGIFNLRSSAPIAEETLRQMLAMIRHRGPDQFGIYLDRRVGLGNARLSILDLGGGQQPICNEDSSLWIVFNGEIFNHVELRPALEAKGHRFATHTDTEVILHLYEEHGPACLEKLNGQFAFAIFNTRDGSLFMARDRLGVRPLFYTTTADGSLIFGSEIKALLADPRVKAAIDPVALHQIFTHWAPLLPRTIFQGIQSLAPGHYLLASQGEMIIRPYWKIQFPTLEQEKRERNARRSADDYVDEFRALLTDATRIRLRADVPVGAYLSGGLDSSVIAAIIQSGHSNRLETFSIAFNDSQFDESTYQQEMARFLGTEHHICRATHADIGAVFPRAVWHMETPVMRTSPAPMLLLSELVRKQNYKVVLTGEGADEFLAGYDIFKETQIRCFWAQQPDSTRRPRLLQRLYPDIPGLAVGTGALLAEFFREGLSDVDHPGYSHALRWKNGRRISRFFSPALRDAISRAGTMDGVFYPPEYFSWGPLQKAQFLEISTFLSPYLLASQGDRVAMANSVEGRYPFLDYRLVEFCNSLPASLKLRTLTEKYLLKKAAAPWLPASIAQRRKRPYRAPIHRSFFGACAPDYVADLLSPGELMGSGLFQPRAVSQLVEKATRGQLGETDDMAVAGIISSELMYRQFIADFRMPLPLGPDDDVKICRSEPPSSKT